MPPRGTTLKSEDMGVMAESKFQQNLEQVLDNGE